MRENKRKLEIALEAEKIIYSLGLALIKKIYDYSSKNNDRRKQLKPLSNSMSVSHAS